MMINFWYSFFYYEQLAGTERYAWELMHSLHRLVGLIWFGFVDVGRILFFELRTTDSQYKIL